MYMEICKRPGSLYVTLGSECCKNSWKVTSNVRSSQPPLLHTIGQRTAPTDGAGNRLHVSLEGAKDGEYFAICHNENLLNSDDQRREVGTFSWSSFFKILFTQCREMFPGGWSHFLASISLRQRSFVTYHMPNLLSTSESTFMCFREHKKPGVALNQGYCF